MEANKSCERSSTRVLRHEVVDRIVAGKKHQCCSCAFGKAEMAIFDKKRRGQRSLAKVVGGFFSA